MLGVPIESRALKGMDSLLSIVQMPRGVPVGTLAIGASGAVNAGLLAIAILANHDAALRERLRAWRAEQEQRGPPGRAAVTGPILPGATIGVLGSGQLGRMFAMAAVRMGYRVHTLSPDEDTPTGQVADLEITAVVRRSRGDPRLRAQRGCRHLRVRERVRGGRGRAPASTRRCGRAGTSSTSRSSACARKAFLADGGFPVTPFARLRSASDVADAVGQIGTPAVLKTASFGYDGKGQRKVGSPEEVRVAWDELGGQEAVLERFIDFDREVSMIGVARRERVDRDLRPGREHPPRSHPRHVRLSRAPCPRASSARRRRSCAGCSSVWTSSACSASSSS